MENPAEILGPDGKTSKIKGIPLLCVDKTGESPIHAVALSFPDGNTAVMDLQDNAALKQSRKNLGKAVRSLAHPATSEQSGG